MPTKLLDLEPQRRDAILNAALKDHLLVKYWLYESNSGRYPQFKSLGG